MRVPVSSSFKKAVWSTIFSLCYLIIVYAWLVGMAIVVTLVLGFLMYLAIKASVTILSYLLAFGLLMVVFLVWLFLFRFITRTRKKSMAGLIKILREDEPVIFATIDKIVQLTSAPMPRYVYLDPGINASVFFNASWWGVFFPVRKNLQIGIGLLSTNSVTEIEAVLAHEFGHFGQNP